MGVPGQEGLALLPVERLEHPGHGFPFGILEPGEALQHVVRVGPIAVLAFDLVEQLAEARAVTQDGVKIDEVLPAAPARDGRQFHEGDIPLVRDVKEPVR